MGYLIPFLIAVLVGAASGFLYGPGWGTFLLAAIVWCIGVLVVQRRASARNH